MCLRGSHSNAKRMGRYETGAKPYDGAVEEYGPGIQGY